MVKFLKNHKQTQLIKLFSLFTFFLLTNILYSEIPRRVFIPDTKTTYKIVYDSLYTRIYHDDVGITGMHASNREAALHGFLTQNVRKTDDGCLLLEYKFEAEQIVRGKLVTGKENKTICGREVRKRIYKEVDNIEVCSVPPMSKFANIKIDACGNILYQNADDFVLPLICYVLVDAVPCDFAKRLQEQKACLSEWHRKVYKTKKSNFKTPDVKFRYEKDRNLIVSYKKTYEENELLSDDWYHEISFGFSKEKHYLSKGTICLDKDGHLVYLHSRFFDRIPTMPELNLPEYHPASVSRESVHTKEKDFVNITITRIKTEALAKQEAPDANRGILTNPQRTWVSPKPSIFMPDAVK